MKLNVMEEKLLNPTPISAEVGKLQNMMTKRTTKSEIGALRLWQVSTLQKRSHSFISLGKEVEWSRDVLSQYSETVRLHVSILQSFNLVLIVHIY